MPRPNRPRDIGHEAALSARIRFERESRGWSYDGLALRMDKAGCPINGSAIYKIEHAGRRITVDEFVAFARVFDIPNSDLAALLLPVNVARFDKLRKGLAALEERFFNLRAEQDGYNKTVSELSLLADELGFVLQLPAESAADVSDEVNWIVGIEESK